MDFCTDPNILKALNLVRTLLTIALMAVPLIIIVMTSIDIGKAVVNGGVEQLKKTGMTFLIKVFGGLTIFFIPAIINVIVASVSEYTSFDKADYQSCITNIDNIDYFVELAKVKKEQELAETREKEKAVQDRKAARTASIISASKEYQASQANNNTPSDGGNGENTGVDGAIIGQKYQLTEAQLRGLAMKCQREQGTPVGAAAEASLMANRFELFAGTKYGSNGTGLYNYVANSGWWGKAASIMQNTSSLNPEILAAVKEVLVLGNRTLPFYIDEHDCIYCGKYGYDVTKIVTNGKTITDGSSLKNHANYEKNNTVIYNKYGAVYTFYTFPTASSDPFGYTATAKKKYDAMNSGK